MSTILKDKLEGSDKKYGYVFGCEGFMSMNEVSEELGLHRNSISRRIEDGRLRGGKHPGPDGKKRKNSLVAICRRSVREYKKQVQE